ncbi:hypothetical protein SAMN05661091_4034 [Paenibacillus uliginis N3/975]|uniref:Uncharacterized protein n=1 Tax=Paenibacillus uliginis N3/975 TaxID=1313296 RepID=A0A1X7HJS3_9BACL|nr:hypothetical protein SAMN05661091_4034 [Paenibacillus uliginis N3/975]
MNELLRLAPGLADKLNMQNTSGREAAFFSVPRMAIN